MSSEFLEWFKQQCGSRPGGSKSDLELENICLSLRYQLNQTELTIDLRRQWDLKHTYALYAWNAARSKNE